MGNIIRKVTWGRVSTLIGVVMSVVLVFLIHPTFEGLLAGIGLSFLILGTRIASYNEGIDSAMQNVNAQIADYKAHLNKHSE